jgi:glycosyltransferase involved in cell wall biosynthesis
MAQQVEPLDFEILVIDTGSSDATCAIVRAHSVVLLEVDAHSSYVARNAGIERARGEYLTFLDADCVPVLGWLEALLERAWQEEVDYVAGRIENEIVVDNMANRLLALRTSADIRRRNVLAGGVAGGNMMIHRRVFDRIGPFDIRPSGGDFLQSKRALDAGFRISYAEKAIVRHQCDLSNGDYLARRVRIRRGQAGHAASCSSVWRTIFAIPWRPGFREAANIARSIGKPTASVFAYLWLERWANYVGAVAGVIDRRFNGPLAA